MLLAACGGSDSDDSTSSTTTDSVASEAKEKLKERVAEAKKKLKGEGKGAGQGSGAKGSAGSGQSPPENVATPLEVSGGGSGQFRVKGGDNSIQDYGDEGGESELQEVAEIVHAFFVTRAEKKWEQACSYLSQANIEQLEQLAAQSPQFKDKGCAAVLQVFTRPLPAAVQREITTVDAGSFRRDDEQGFLVYYGAPERTVYAMPLRNEDGTWKVSALSGSAIGPPVP